MKRRLRASEHDEQCVVVQWWDMVCGTYQLPPCALFAIPNANKLLSQAKNRFSLLKHMQAEGVRSGIPDLFLAIPRLDQGGLFIEMKTKTGQTGDSQVDVIGYLTPMYQVKVCYSADEAIAEIKRYLGAIR